MFKLFFINLTNISSEINLSLLIDKKEHPGLNMLTVRIYHKLFTK